VGPPVVGDKRGKTEEEENRSNSGRSPGGEEEKTEGKRIGAKRNKISRHVDRKRALDFKGGDHVGLFCLGADQSRVLGGKKWNA